MALYAIGDIHGCAETLWNLLDELNVGPDDHLVFIGDYIDRGPDSHGVIAGLIDLSDTVRCTFLRGNHEKLLLDYLDFGDFNSWLMNGAEETLRSYPNRRIPPEH
ncbi:MAG: metallophosphoesterase, partial [Rhodothermales bacterium]